jgi:hypothetical protein
MTHKNVAMAGGVGIIIVLFAVGMYVSFQPQQRGTENHRMEMTPATSPENAAYMLDGMHVELKNGEAEVEAAPGSASKITTKIFGNELKTDLNGDGREDVAFILVQSSGGSGTFYYAVAALNTKDGWVGSDGYLLGDRIAPQATTLSPNPKQKGVVVFNYAERAPNEPMTTPPSIGKSVYLKLDPQTMQWGVVLPNFEGESR